MVAMAVNNEIGTIQDTAPIAAICAEVGVHFICDAVQAPLALDLDARRPRCRLNACAKGDEAAISRVTSGN